MKHTETTFALRIAYLRHLICFHLLLLAPLQSLQAEELRFSKLDRGDGLSQESVTALAQDQYQFIWIGTEDGLARYDGRVLTMYRNDPDDHMSIQDNVITALAYDSNNRLWVGSESDGASYYDYKSDQFISIDTALVGTNIKNIFATNQSKKAIIHSELGLFNIEPDNEVIRLIEPHQDRKVIYAYHVAGSIQVVYNTGELMSISTTDFSYKEFILSDIKISQAWTIDSCNTLFLASPSDNNDKLKLYCNNGTETKESPINKILNHANLQPSNILISDIVEQEDGTLWISSQVGLIKINNSKLSLSRHLSYDEHSISSNDLTKLLLAKNTLLIGSEYDGLNMHQTANLEFQYFNLLNSGTKWNDEANLKTLNEEKCGPAPAVDYDTVWSILKDTDGDLWVGNNHGVAIRKNGTDIFKDYSRIGDSENYLDLCSVWSLAETDGIIWIGIWGGLIALDKSTGTFKHYKSQTKAGNENKLSGKFVRLLLHDKLRNSLWIGTNANGLNRMDLTTHEITQYPFSPDEPQQLPHGRIRSLYLDLENRLWIGSGGGLSLWDEASNTFKTLASSSNSTDLSDEDVRAIDHYRDDYYWIGTGNGIDLFNAEKFLVEKRLNEKDGLSNSTVYAMIQDDTGHYWITTANGLSKFDPDTYVFQNYSYQHGLQSNEFNFNAWHKNTDGSIFIGGANGLNVVYPEKSINNENTFHPIMISIVGTNEEGKKLTISRFPQKNEKHEVPSSFRNINFHYTYPAFSDQSQIFSQHKLTNNSEAWSAKNPTSHRAVYTNINAGHHYFQIKSNSNVKEFSQFPIYIAPYIWEQVWFRILLAILTIAALTYVFIYYSRERVRASAELLTRQHYHILAHELSPHLEQARTNLNTLASSSTNLDKDFINTSIRPLMNKSLSFLDNVRDIVNFEHAVKQPKHLYMLEDILDEVLLYADSQASRICTNEIEDVNIHTHQGAVYLLLVNLISNALKYSDPTSNVHLNITTNSHNLIIECADNGIGISPEKRKLIYQSYTRLPQKDSSIAGLGLGLTIVKSIVHTYNGNIRIEANQPKGSQFIVTLTGVVAND